MESAAAPLDLTLSDIEGLGQVQGRSDFECLYMYSMS